MALHLGARLHAFVHDHQTGATTLASVDSAGLPGNGGSFGPALSADGRYVAFASEANNLVIGDTNAATDVFMHDYQTGTTTRMSVSSAGVQGNNWSVYPSISADGRCVAFGSLASNLVPGDTNNVYDAFVHDCQRPHAHAGGDAGLAVVDEHVVEPVCVARH